MSEAPDEKGIVKLPVDWAEHNKWRCLFCDGDIDFHSSNDNELLYVDDSYKCQANGHLLCRSAYFMVRWSKTMKGENGDAKTLARWVEIEFDGSLS